MPWTTPKTWAVGELVTAAMLNQQLRDNLNVLKNPTTHAQVYNNGADWITSNTAFVPVDTTNLKLTLTTQGGTVLVWFSGAVSANAGDTYAMFDIRVDGSGRVGALWNGGLAVIHTSTRTQQIVVGPFLIDGLPAGTHTFELLWKCNGGAIYLRSNAANATHYLATAPVFSAREI